MQRGRRSSSFFLMMIMLCFGRAVTGEDIGLSLDGENDYALANSTVFPNSSSLQSFTIETWMYPRSAGSFIATDDAYDLILLSSPGGPNGGVGIRVVLYQTPGNNLEITEFRDVALNQWNHLAMMFDAPTNQISIAINGILSEPTVFEFGSFFVDPNQQFAVGAFGTSGVFEGYMDEFRVSNSVRYTSNFTPTQTFSSDVNTKALYHFNEMAGSTMFTDASGNGNTLTGFNGAQTGIIPPKDDSLPGDFDSDGDVDGRDFLAWQRNPSLGDVTDWQANYGTGSPRASIGVPEPVALWVLLVGLAVVPLRSAGAPRRG